MSHKFILGQAVGYTPSRGRYAPPGIYLVTAKLPERDFMRPADEARQPLLLIARRRV
jgi:hypothetical protein